MGAGFCRCVSSLNSLAPFESQLCQSFENDHIRLPLELYLFILTGWCQIIPTFVEAKKYKTPMKSYENSMKSQGTT